MSDGLIWEVVGLITLLSVGLLSIAHVWYRSKRLISFSSIALVAFLIIYPLSGIAHLLSNHGQMRGYYDLYGSTSDSLIRLTVVWVGFLSLALPIFKYSPPQSGAAVESGKALAGSAKTLFSFGLITAALAGPAAFQMLAYAEMLGSQRIIALTGGLARVGFMSQWVAWAMSFIALALLVNLKRMRSRFVVPLTVSIACVSIAVSLSWTGGRSIGVMLATPLVVATWPWITKTARLLMFIALGILLTGAVIGQTAARSAASAAAEFSLARVLDWEMGRYSMIGYATDSAIDRGYLWGETIAEGLLQVPVGVARLFGLNLSTELKSSTHFTGTDLLGDPGQFYIVPGLLPEWYMNFGLAGVATVCLAIGVAISFVDKSLRSAQEPVGRMFYGYMGVLLIFCTFSAQSGSLPNYAIFTGLPLLALFAVSTPLRSRRLSSEGVSFEGSRNGKVA